MKLIQNDIKTFMLAAGQECPDRPTVVPDEVRFLRAKLILEEAFEQCEALGVQVALEGCPVGYTPFSADMLEFHSGGTLDLVKIADGIADQIYVSVGTAVALGIDMENIWHLVQTANMAKFGPGSYKRPDGKQMKPPGWTPPDEAIREELKNQCFGD